MTDRGNWNPPAQGDPPESGEPETNFGKNHAAPPPPAAVEGPQAAQAPEDLSDGPIDFNPDWTPERISLENRIEGASDGADPWAGSIGMSLTEKEGER